MAYLDKGFNEAQVKTGRSGQRAGQKRIMDFLRGQDKECAFDFERNSEYEVFSWGTVT